MGVVKDWQQLFPPTARQLRDYTSEKPSTPYDRIRFSKGRGRAQFKVFEPGQNELLEFLDTGEFNEYPICRVWLSGRRTSLVGQVKIEDTKIAIETTSAVLAWVSTVVDTSSSPQDEELPEKKIAMPTNNENTVEESQAPVEMDQVVQSDTPFRGKFDPKLQARGGAFGKAGKPQAQHNLTFDADIEDSRLDDARSASFHKMLTNRRVYQAFKHEGLFIRFRKKAENAMLAGELYHLCEAGLAHVDEKTSQCSSDDLPPIHAIRIPISETFGLLFRWNKELNKFDMC